MVPYMLLTADTVRLLTLIKQETVVVVKLNKYSGVHTFVFGLSGFTRVSSSLSWTGSPVVGWAACGRLILHLLL